MEDLKNIETNDKEENAAGKLTEEQNIDEEILDADRELAGLSEMGKKSCIGLVIFIAHNRCC